MELNYIKVEKTLFQRFPSPLPYSSIIVEKNILGYVSTNKKYFT